MGDRCALDVATAQIRAADLVGPEQEKIRQRILEFCADHPDALLRTCEAGHLTGSSVVVDPEAQRVLLIHHVKLERWLQPGGHADGEGDLGLVAIGEAEEETGLSPLTLLRPAIDVDIHEIPARNGEPAHLHLDLRFLVLAPSGATPDPNHETLGAAWVGTHDPAGLIASDELRRLVDRGLAVAAERSHGPR